MLQSCYTRSSWFVTKNVHATCYTILLIKKIYSNFLKVCCNIWHRTTAKYAKNETATCFQLYLFLSVYVGHDSTTSLLGVWSHFWIPCFFLVGWMESINVPSVLHEAGDAEGLHQILSVSWMFHHSLHFHILLDCVICTRNDMSILLLLQMMGFDWLGLGLGEQVVGIILPFFFSSVFFVLLFFFLVLIHFILVMMMACFSAS